MHRNSNKYNSTINKQHDMLNKEQLLKWLMAKQMKHLKEMLRLMKYRVYRLKIIGKEYSTTIDCKLTEINEAICMIKFGVYNGLYRLVIGL